VKWVKHGIVWRPDGSEAWAASHATCPTPLTLADGTLRVFVQCRDAGNVGRVAWVDLDPQDPRRVIRECREPALDVGPAGAFDDNGVFPTCVLPRPDGRLFLYYVGFELCHHIRYRLLTGLAISHDGGNSFERASGVPILERSTPEPLFRCAPWVVDDEPGLRMWYVAGGAWQTIDGKSMPVYDIRHLRSDDGVLWPAQGHVVLPLTRDGEHGFGRPYVTRHGRRWQMHYSVRHRDAPTYRLGLAESQDGLVWHREDETLGLGVTPGSWDSDSIEYGAPVAGGGRHWLLYNGNDFGRDGFGIAEQVQD
jgi:predicted GH43/DUF377 family glycosyl hydrolase